MSADDLRQMMINDRGELVPDDRGPLTWDGEPIYHSETVREGSFDPLFDPSAFEQLAGQLPMDLEGGES